MFVSAQEFISFITKRVASKHKDYQQFVVMMEELGNPQYELKKCIHIGGTNGKGSTTNYLRAILQENQYKVASFTSPHLVSHNDRIRINNIPISDKDLLYYGNKIAQYIDQYDLSMFEIDMLLAIYYFIDQEVDYVLFEVGLGGRLDATNVILPMVSIITNIGYDHMEYLGDTLEKIAFEKAGIVKDGIPLFTMENKEECLSVFYKKTKEKNTVCYQCNLELKDIKVENGIYFTYKNRENLFISSLAQYQLKNVSLVLDVIDYMQQHNLVKVEENKIRKAISTAIWQGRFEIVSNHPLIILDGAHNEHGMQALSESLSYLKKPICVIFAALKDKKYDKMLQLLIDNSVDQVVLTEFDFYRAQKAENLLNDQMNFSSVLIEKDYMKAVKFAKENYNSGTILITGSLYFISEVREMLINEEVVE